MNEKKSMTENNLEERDTVEAPLTATSLQRPLFWQTVHALTLVFNQVVERFSCIIKNLEYLRNKW